MGAAFAVSFGLVVAGSLGAALLKNLLHAVLFLALALLGVAGLFLMLSSTFLFVVQILVYVGGVVILLIFGVMLTSKMAQPDIPPRNRQTLAAALLALLLFCATAYVLTTHPWMVSAEPPAVPVAEIGVGLLQKYVLPFEIVSVVLLVAMVGAIVLARREPESK
ncbi:NADH-quinone oxidoreductase subunit J [bacterium]|nr:NADH-quinone oxidoreductase subunit J [bacterium]